MMNQGGHTVSEVDHSSTQSHQLGGIQQPTHVYVSYPPPAAPPWSNQRIDNTTTENGVPSGSGYGYNQHSEHVGFTPSKDVQQTVGAPSHSSTTGVGNAAQYGYAPYSTSSDPYGHGAAGYQGQSYYYGYDQQSNLSYPQHSGAYQTSGAPYQTHTSSFQDSQPSSYTGTYYNTGDYQTTTNGYQTGGYPGQANYWNDGSYGSYPHYYSSYTNFDSNSAHSSSSANVALLQYQQQYKQWADCYSQSTDVTCAPGTETVPVTTSASASSSSSVQCEIAGTNGGYYSASCSQPPPPGTSSWQPDPCASEFTMQESAKLGNNYEDAWSNMSPGFSEDVATYGKKPLEPASLHNNYNSQQAIAPPTQATALQYSAHQYAQNFQAPSQSIPSVDTGSMTKLQIPTNPRIVSNLPVSLPKTNKDACPTDALSKPAYISVAIPKHSRQATSADVADPMLKQQFPASLCAYVERALARCKDDIQKTACQNLMKEIITKASTDGTLFTRNWDVEPLFPLPAVESASSIPQVSVLPKYKRSPSRRSRWEPLPEEKVVEKPSSINYDPIRDVGGSNLNLRERMVNNGRLESKFQGDSKSKSFLSQDKHYQCKSEQRLVKKARLADAMNGAIENGDASNDSDEQSLTAYYAAPINLANSPEERKKRESRFKRFDKDQESKSFRAKGVGPGNAYAKWANASLDNKKREEGPSRAVEDMDWDSLTVKGTCQDIEKRYLRLTSAPDPASVRPEEVLEKALLMVQYSQKNYLYKCDQLKSIRQDLTVQRIRNELTVKVYETHARLALEAGDLPEYNQCQSQLKILYSEGIKGCHMEFAAYNLLCVILHSNNNRELLSSMARLSADAKRDEAVKHALAVLAAVTSGNYVLFFRLYKTAPNLNTCLMDLYVERMRFEAVKCMSRSYRPSVPVVYIAQVLGFPSLGSPEEVGENKFSISSRVEDCVEWLRAHGANLNEDSNGEMQLDTKASSSTLYMPEPEDAVAHGDANLAVNDFLTRTL